MMKLNGLLVGIAGMGLLLAGCDKSASVSTGTDITLGALVGKWVTAKAVTTGTVTISAPGQVVQQQPVKDTSSYTDDKYFIKFSVDPNTYDANFPQFGVFGGPESGTWKLSGSTITAVSTTNDTTKIDADLNGDSGVFTVHLDRDAGGGTYNFAGTSVLTVTRK